MYLEAIMIKIEVWGVGHAIIYYVSQTITITIQLNHGLQKPLQILIILGVFHSTGTTPIQIVTGRSQSRKSSTHPEFFFCYELLFYVFIHMQHCTKSNILSLCNLDYCYLQTNPI